MTSSFASSSSPQPTSSTARSSGSSASASSTSPPLSTPQKTREPGVLMLDTTPPPDPTRMERIAAAKRRMKRYVFDQTPRVDWKSIPTFDEEEENSFDHDALARRPDLWCEASRNYRDQVISKYRERKTVDSRFDVFDSGEQIVDMIG